MVKIPEPIEFEWDKGNRDKNYQKHRVSNQEAEEVFSSVPVFVFFDAKHSASEKRYMIWGLTENRRNLAIFFTIRDNRIRVISARDLSREERKAYEEKTQANSGV